jgi:hypothetical protein
MKRAREEWVRQELIQTMTKQLGYPRHELKSEVALSNLEHLKGVKVPLRRLDLVCFSRDVQADVSIAPLLIVECKAHKLDKKAFEQLCGYNHWVRAPFIALSNFHETIMGAWNHEDNGYRLIKRLMTYQELKRYTVEKL